MSGGHVQDMRPDIPAAETLLIDVDELMTVNDEGFDIVDVGAAPLLVVGAISPAVLVAIEVAQTQCLISSA